MQRQLATALPFLSLLPFLMSLVGAAGSPRLAEVPEPPPRPPLAFQQYAVNFREVPPRPLIQAHFDFMNRGDQPIRITELDPSCGCLAPRLHADQRVYQPGERGRFYVSVQTANERPGPHAYTVNVRYEDSAPHEELLVFRMTLPERKLTVAPAELIFYPAPGTSESQMTYVTDFRGGAIEVLEAVCQLDFVQLEVLPRETDERGNPRVPVRVTVPGDFPPGRHTGLISLRTSDPEFQRVHAAVLVQGQTPVQPVGFEEAADGE